MHKTENKSHKIALLITIIIILILVVIFPAFISDAIDNSDYSAIITILLHLPGFFILMGLLEVWFPEKYIVKYLGKKSGTKGSVLSFLLGSIMPGPIYLGFPIAGLLLKKKVSMFNVALFIGAWSSFKLGEEIFELEFLGWKFLLIRILISIPFVIMTAYILSKAHLKEEIIRREEALLSKYKTKN